MNLKRDYIYILIIILLVLFYNNTKVKINKQTPNYKLITKDIKIYKDSINILKNKIDVTNQKVNRLNTDLLNVRLQKDEIKKRYRTELSKLRSVTPEECDTVFVTYDAFIDSLEGVHSLEIKTIESVISNKDSIIHYQQNIINSNEEIEDALQTIISQQVKDKKELKRKKNKQIVIGVLGGFVAGVVTSIFI
jgi:hypothetical protein